MGKKQTFLDKTRKKKNVAICPVCEGEIQRIRHVKAVKGQNGTWRFRDQNIGVCKCNEKDIYV